MPSVTVRKALRVMQTQGVSGLMKRGTNEILGACTGYLTLRKRSNFDDIEDLVEFTNKTCRGLIAPFQVRWEIVSLLQLVRELKPKTLLEIGTANGGTLFLWSRILPEDAHLVSVDLPGGKFGDGYAIWRAPIYRSFAVGKQRLDLVRGNSHDTSTRDEAVKLLDGKPVDLLFIDGGHTYDDVRQDFEMYSSLVAPDGVIAFHDVAKHPPTTGCEVHRFWAEIQPQYNSGEFIQDAEQGWAGIGYIRWTKD